MLSRLIEWSLRNGFVVLLATGFVVAAGVFAVLKTPLDALPDLSDVQVIVYTEYPGQAPQVVEDQVTYPLTSALLGAPKSKVVRGFSFFGVSFVYVLFEDGTDIYWARSRVLEYLNAAAGRLPGGVNPVLGPDASGVGWVYQFVLQSAQHSLAQLRSLQDWFVRYQLSPVSGVAEVAGIGGFVQQYQVVVDPRRLQGYGIPLARVAEVIRAGNRDVGGRVLELSEAEYMVRGRGYLKGIADIEQLVLQSERGTPILLRDVARVELAPDERRGIVEHNGEGEAVAGTVVARYGENALDLIERVKDRLAEIKPGLPEGVEILNVYDRSALIERAVATLNRTLVEEMLIVAAVCTLFLLHVRSALVAILMLPVGVLMAFIVMQVQGVSANIMSLGGIAIAIGAMVDAAIVMIENAHKHLERAAPGTPRLNSLLNACREVGPSLFFSLLVITVSFLPVFTLEAQEGRLFAPLAYTKTYAMAGAAILSVTLVPALMLLLVRGRIRAEAQNPLNRVLIALYRPVIATVLRYKGVTLALALAALASSLWPLARLGSEFMPQLNEGTLFYMPTALPGLSVTQAAELLQKQDRIIKSFPEVESVFGKAGRMASATDPAPLEMFETVIQLRPEAAWRPGMTLDRLTAEMDRALQFPGVANSWTMPIKARIDMLSTGIRTPVGVKVFGGDLAELERLARQVEKSVKAVPGAGSVYAERVVGGRFVEIVPDRTRLARYGLSIDAVQETIALALGGETLTTTVEGRERYGVALRYPRDLRDHPEAIAREVLVATPAGAQIPLGQVARVQITQGAPGIRTENGMLVGYVFVDVRGRDIGSFVAEAQARVAQEVVFPAGYYASWSGQYEYMQRAIAKLKIVVPATLCIIFVLLYLNFRRISDALIVMLSVPFALVGGVWFLWYLDYNLSVAVAVGLIALAGVAAETGVVMLLYLDHAWHEVKARCVTEGTTPSLNELYAAIMHGAVERVRPKMMTVTAIMAGLLPILWSTGTGSEVMRRIAAPMVGGMVTSTLLTLIVIPAIYAVVHQKGLHK